MPSFEKLHLQGHSTFPVVLLLWTFKTHASQRQGYNHKLGFTDRWVNFRTVSLLNYEFNSINFLFSVNSNPSISLWHQQNIESMHWLHCAGTILCYAGFSINWRLINLSSKHIVKFGMDEPFIVFYLSVIRIVLLDTFNHSISGIK